MTKQSFFKGTVILMIANLINRIFGFTLRIALVRLIGDEALGLFQMVYPLFTTLLIICAAGFPVAIAKLIPEEIALDNNHAPYIYIKITLIFIGILTVTLTVIFIGAADFIAKQIITDKRTYFIILSLAPALIFSTLASSLRGFFQGLHDMTPIAVSQITEQLCRFLSTIIIINMISVLEIKYQASGIAAGMVIGELCGFLLISYIFIKHLYSSPIRNKSGRQNNLINIFKKITNMAFPIALGKLVNSIMWSAEAIFIPRQLHLAGFNKHQSASLFGQLTGMAEPIIFLPTVITLALNKSLLPTVSAAQAQGNLKKIRNIHFNTFRISTYIGFPVITFCILLGNKICYLLYGLTEAGQILSILGLSAPFIYYYHISSGMLQGLGRPKIALLNLSIGSIIKIIGILNLTPVPSLGIYGAALSIGLNYFIACLLNYLSIKHFTNDNSFHFQTIFKPLIGCSLLFVINPYLQTILSSYIPHKNLNIIFTLLIFLLIYSLFMFLSGAITTKDLNMFKK